MTMDMLLFAVLGLLMCLYAMQAEILRAGVHIGRNANVLRHLADSETGA